MKRVSLFFAGGMILIVVLALLGAYILVSGISYTIAAFSFFGILYIAFMLYREFVKNNRRLFHFFSSLKNGDASAVLLVRKGNAFEQLLTEEMNTIAELIRDQKQKNEELTLYHESIMRMMAHELRNTITPISSLSDILLKEICNSENSQLIEDLEIISSQSKILQAYVDAYHRLVCLPDPVKETIDAHLFFQKFERVLQGEDGYEKVSFHMNTDIQFRVDPGMLTLALLHIVRNGLQAIEGQTQGYVRIRIEKKNLCMIEVEDNGSGIPVELQSSVFTPFFSTKQTGSGIGLSMSRRIMQLHGGEITINSQPGKTIVLLRFL